jgi:Kae1-associated kinase Bud32
MNKAFSQGAEGVLYKTENNSLLKIREPKPYRIAQLDKKLRKNRTRHEANILEKAHNFGLNVPKVINSNEKTFSLELEFIDGENLKHCLTETLLENAWDQVILLHSNNIIHSDLTTLNMIVSKNKVYVIDFGLSFISTKIEDKAVDLHLFLQCLKNEHPNYYCLKEKLISKYLSTVNRAPEIIKRLEIIEKRGRNK